MINLTPKQENFCLAYLETGNASEAYRRSYDAENMKAETVAKRASELLANGAVTGRITELRAVAAKRNAITVDHLIVELEEGRRAALDAETAQASAAVAATMAKAKLLGLDKQIIEQTVTQTTELSGEVRLITGLADKLGAIKGKK